jgi:DNA-binding MarR family transcriptional regulator
MVAMTRTVWVDGWSPHHPGWASGRHVIIAARRVSRSIDTRLEAELAGCGVTGAQLELLDRLAGDRDAHVAALARALGIRRQSASALVERLRLSGLVELLALDAGVRVPRITEEGERRRRQAHRATTGSMSLIEAIALDDRACFVDVAGELDRSLRRDDAVG